MFNSNIVGRWMAVILGLVGLFYLVFPLATRGPVGHIPPAQRSGQSPPPSAHVSPPTVPTAAPAAAAEAAITATRSMRTASIAGSTHLDVIRDNPDFSGDGGGAPVAPPPTHTYQDGAVTMHVPGLDEQQIERANYASQLDHLLAHLTAENLDGALQEYSTDYRTLLAEMGLRPACTSGPCGLRLGAGGFLDGMSALGLQEGDELLTLNATPLDRITDYEQFKSVLFGHGGSIELGFMHAGEIRSIHIPVEPQPAP